MSDASVPALDPTTGLPVSTAPVTAAVGATTAPPAPAVSTPAAATPSAAPAPAAAPTDPALLDALASLQAEVASLKAQAPAAKAVEIPDNPPSATNLFTKGQVVAYAWDDPYDGPSKKFGLVLDVLPDEGSGAQSKLAWFAETSGPIGDHLLTAV